MCIRFLQLLIFTCTIFPGLAQVFENFSDGDFTNDPVWTGDQEDFEVHSNGELHLMAPVAGTSQLVTESSLFDKVVWEFTINLDFNPSSSNLAKVYLMSDQPDLEGSLNGFYLMIGDTEDEISLYKQEGLTSTYVINGVDGTVAGATRVGIKVIRDQTGRWTLYQDLTGGKNYESVGSMIDEDPDILSTAYFGFLCQYTITRADKFYFDDVFIEQLRVDSVIVRNVTSIEILFNQYLLVSEGTDVSNFFIDGLTISESNLASGDSSRLLITLDPNTPLQTGNYILEVSQDLTLNEIEEAVFSYEQLSIDTVLTLSDNQILIDFNGEPDQLSAEEVLNYTIDQGIGNPVSAAIETNDRSQVILTLGSSLSDGITYELSTGVVTNLSGNSEFSGIANFTFIVPLLIEFVEVLSEDSLFITFNKNLDPASVIPENFLVNQGIGSPVSSVLAGEQESIFLMFDAEFGETAYELSISGLKDQEGFGITPGSSLSFEYLPMKVSMIMQEDFESIAVMFNQRLDPTSAENTNNYEITEFGIPAFAEVYSENDSLVILQFPDLINSSYQLIVDGVENSDKNSIIGKDTLEFHFEKPTSLRSLQINEVMADFSPSVGLPEAEYVELYNPGDYALELENFLLNGESIPTYLLSGGGYVVVTDDSNTGLFDDISTIYLSSFDALINGGDSVILRDQFGNVVDSIYYDLDWYQDAEKDDGGFSLEQINPNLSCSDETNWSASHESLGGTPGLANSIFNNELDVQGPEIIELDVVSADTLLISFNEPVDPETVNVQNLSLASGTDIAQIIRHSYREFELILNQPLTSESYHQLMLENIADCQGNLMLKDTLTFYFDDTAPILEELVIVSGNEIALVFHEPLKESSAEDEENFLLANDIGEPTRSTVQDSTLHRVQLVFDSLFQIGESYELSISNIEDTLGNKIDKRTIRFEFLDLIDSVYVIAANLITVRLKEAPAVPVELASFLVSKEIGYPSFAEVDTDDPYLIRLGFNNNLKANTDYLLFIKDLSSAETSQKLITPSKPLIYDTRAPRIKGIIVLNDTEIVIQWDEPIRLNSAFSTIQYEIENYGHPVDLSAIDDRQMKLTFDFEIPQEENLRLKASGIEDLYANKSGTLSRDFIYDTRPPEIKSMRMVDPNTLLVALSEKSDTSSVYSLDNYFMGGQNPNTINISGPDSLRISLHFSEIPENEQQLISIKGLKDQFQNQMDSSGYYFNSLNPVVSSLVFTSDSTIELTFSKSMSNSVLYFSNYQIINNTVRDINSLSTSKVELLLETRIHDGDSVHLQFENLSDLSGNPLIENRKNGVFETYLEDWRLIDQKTVELTFETDFKVVNKDQFLLESLQPILVQLDGENQKILRLVFKDSLSVDQQLHLSWSSLADLYERRIPDFQIPIFIDQKPPQLISLESDFGHRVNLIFDESLPSTSRSSNHYKVLEPVKILEIVQASENIISLFFNELTDQQDYQIVLGGISDRSGNIVDTDTVRFKYQLPFLPRKGDVFITELMVDPTPAVGLPEYEYVELFNASDSVIRLNSLLFSDASKQVFLPEVDFQPKTYLVLSGGNIDGGVVVSGFPTLDNSGDSLTLSNITGEVIDQVVYSRDWYGDTEKDDGGFSLEMINPESACPGIVNWGPSMDAKGGTPGEQNSIHNLSPDAEPPTLLNYQLSENQIRLNFSESLDSLSIMLGNYQLVGKSISASGISGSYPDHITLKFESPIEAGKLHSLHVSGPADCSGNEIDPFTLSIGLGVKPGFNDLIISEIMADPDPVVDLPNSEYLEIYNRTDKLISLENVRIRDSGGEMKLPSMTIGGKEYMVLVPTSAVNQFDREVIGVPNWRSLNNEGESLVIFHGDELIFNVEYDRNWNTIFTDGGVSLEMRDVNNPCAGPVNWGNAESPDGGTPGYVNSISESIPDNFGPELVGVYIQSDVTIRLNFNEQLALEEITPDQLEILPGPIQVSGVEMDTLERHYLMVNLSEKLILNTNYSITINHVKDCLGNPIGGSTMDFLLPEPADSFDVIINEVLFNPRELATDFVEIYNRSNKNIDLKGWRLGRQYDDVVAGFIITENSYILRPSEYTVLTVGPNSLLTNYPNARQDRILQMDGMTAYPNETARIMLQDGDPKIIDAFEYHEDMHLSLLESVDGVSLERISFDQPTQDPNNWQSASSTVGFATPGYQNSQSLELTPSGILTIEPKVFVPGNFGSIITPDFATINYQLASPGQLANVNIYNRNGQLIKNLASGISLASNGFLRWDGTTDGGTVASMGFYLIVFELYDSSGFREVMKETVVVGR